MAKYRIIFVLIGFSCSIALVAMQLIKMIDKSKLPQTNAEYHINIDMDTVYLYSEDFKLIKKGDFDSLQEYILNDNL